MGAKTVDWKEVAPEQLSGDSSKEPESTTLEPPPVRGKTSGESSDVDADAARMVASRRKRSKLMIIGVIAFLFIGLGTGGYFAWTSMRETEEGARKIAENLYNNGDYSSAASHFRNRLIEKYPDSEHLEYYQFMADLCDVREDLKHQEDLKLAFQKTNQFIDQHKDDPKLKAKAQDLGKSIEDRVKTTLEKPGKFNDALAKKLNETEANLNQLRSRLAKVITEKQLASIGKRMTELRGKIEQARKRNLGIEEMRALLKTPTARSILEARNLLARHNALVPGFANDPEATAIIPQLYELHRKQVQYVPGPVPGKPKKRKIDGEPSEVVTPLVHEISDPNLSQDKIVLALARGVLYVLRASDGARLWEVRVGIDTTTLPIHVPVGSGIDEMLLVTSTSTKTLTALRPRAEPKKRKAWSYQFDSAPLGQPVRIKDRLYVTTFDGTVHELEIIGGTLLGRYQLGQPLSVGAAYRRHDRHDLLYVAAEDSCIFVLDLTSRTCREILYTWHPSGSVRSRPLLVGGAALPEEFQTAGIPGYLVLNQTRGLDATELKVYQLPITQREQKPISLTPVPRLQGWTWFPPYHDSEKMILLSDAARLGLFGIRQKGNDDGPLFPLIAAEQGTGKDRTYVGIDLSRHLNLQPVDANQQLEAQPRGRAQIAHVIGNELWVMARGRLQRMEILGDQQAGPQPVQVWRSPLRVGSPLHEAQVQEDFEGTHLFVVTRGVDGTGCFVSAVNAEAPWTDSTPEDRRLVWQRQLGMICATTPFRLGKEIIAMDEAGALHRFVPGRIRTDEDQIPVGKAVAGGLEGVQVLPGDTPDDKYLFSTSGQGHRLVLRHYEAFPNGQFRGRLTQSEKTLKVYSVAGQVARVGDSLIVPLVNGKLSKHKLPLSKEELTGPNWRSRRASPSSECFVVPVGKTQFLTTDGDDGIRRWEWEGRFYSGLPATNRTHKTLLDERIVRAPLVLSTDPLRVLVADRTGRVSVLEGELLSVDPSRQWKLGGRITAGPFLRGKRVGCVVDETKLVWIDPARGIEWQYDTNGETIVGEPEMVEEMLVIADQSGRYVGVDPLTGTRLSDGYQVQATAAPSSAPIANDKETLFAPLTDGTIMYISLKHLRPPEKKKK